MPDLKISQFENGGAIQPGDEIATNREGVNTKVFAGSAAAADIGSGPDDISTNSTISANLTNTLRGTSVTSVAVGVGSKEFVTQTDRAFDIGATLLVTSDSDPENIRMTGIVTAYNPATGDLEIDVSKSTGAGSYDDWTIRVAGDVGAKGDTGDKGDQGDQGDPGEKGDQGDPGTNGTNGWTPELALITDDERRVQQVVDWVGGSGTKPATGDYVGVSGLVSDIGDAVDVRGEPGEGAVSSVNDIGPDGLGNVELNADDIPYDNSTSGLTANDVQSAIDEVDDFPKELSDKGTVTSGTVTFDLSVARAFKITQNGSITLAVSNANPSGQYTDFNIFYTYTSGTPTYFSGINWANGEAPAFEAGKKYHLVFCTSTGTTWDGFWQQVGA